MAQSFRRRFFARHAKSSAVLVTMAVHVGLLFIALSYVVFTIVQTEEEEDRFAFEQVEQSRKQLKKRGVPINFRKKTISDSVMPKWTSAAHKIEAVDLKLPDLPGISGGLGNPSSGLDVKGFGLGSEIDFFGIMGGGGHVVFIIDYSASMQGEKETIMRREVARILRELARETDFAVIFFAGPAWSAGTIGSLRQGDWVMTLEGAFTYRPKDWNRLPEVRYRKASHLTVSSIIKEVENTPLAWGTVYDCPIFMALSMDPMPDTIFFMTDGECDEERGILSLEKMVAQLNAAGKPVPVMHTVGFGIREDEQLEEMARLMGGECHFLTTREYIRKYGPSRRRYKPRYSDGDDFDSIESAPADQYPIDFLLQ